MVIKGGLRCVHVDHGASLGSFDHLLQTPTLGKKPLMASSSNRGEHLEELRLGAGRFGKPAPFGSGALSDPYRYTAGGPSSHFGY